MSTSITIQIPDEMETQLETICEQENKEIDEILYSSLSNYITRHQLHHMLRETPAFPEHPILR